MSKVVTGKVRFSYVALMIPKMDLNGKEKYSVTALLPKSDIQSKQAIDAAIQQAIADGTNGIWKGLVPPQIPTPIHDGDGVKQDGTPYGPECKGHWVFTASTNANPQYPKPEVVDATGQPILQATEVYSGMYGRLSVTFAPYFSAGKKGIGCYLNHAQKLEDGEPLAGTKASASEDFGCAAPAYPQAQAPAYPQAQAPAYPQANQPLQQPTGYQPLPDGTPAIDPITGQPIVGQIMGI